MNKLNLVFLLMTGASLQLRPAMAQRVGSTAIEKEMMGNRIGKIQAATIEILKGKNFLAVADAGEQLKNTAAAVVPIAFVKPYKKALTKSAIYKRLRQSTVVFATGSTHGTGYVIDASGIIVTNRHILGSYADTAHHNQVMLVTDYAGKVYPVLEILSNSFINDLVIVKIDTGGDLFTPLPLGGRMEEGDDVFILGHPGEMPYYFSAGMVNRVLIRNSTTHTPGEDFEMFVSAEYGAGSSGSPVVDQHCNLVSTVSAASALYGEKDNPQMVYRLTIPVIALQQLIRFYPVR
jgi:serine protease Do